MIIVLYRLKSSLLSDGVLPSEIGESCEFSLGEGESSGEESGLGICYWQ
jgi:hypothetical protein